MSGIDISRASSRMAMRLKMRGGGGGQDKTEVGDEGRDVEMRRAGRRERGE